MATDFKLSKKHDFCFKFDVDGEEVIKTVSIDMTDNSLGKKLIAAQDKINEKVKKVKIKDVEFKSKEFPKNLDTFDDFSSLSDDQREDIVGYIDALEDYENKMNEIIINEINDSLDTDFSPVFEYLRPIDDYDGEPFAVAVLKNLGDKIIAYSKKIAKEKEKKASKKDYMRKYK